MTHAASAKASVWRGRSVLPGFGLSLGFTLFYLSFIVLIPLAALILRPWAIGLDGFLALLAEPRIVAALKLSFGMASLAAVINAAVGLLIAWTLTRYRFPLKRLIDALIDLPFALPTAVAGIALSGLYAPNGWLGEPLAKLGIKIGYTPWGVLVALLFIGLPFVVRTLQPVIADLGLEVEEASATLGASRITTLRRVVFPTLVPALITGAGLAFARAVGEYGSVIFIAGNLPMRSEIAPLLIVIKLEQYDYSGAAAIGVIMLAASFLILLLLNAVQAAYGARR